jgi:hypothetical protein
MIVYLVLTLALGLYKHDFIAPTPDYIPAAALAIFSERSLVQLSCHGRYARIPTFPSTFTPQIWLYDLNLTGSFYKNSSCPSTSPGSSNSKTSNPTLAQRLRERFSFTNRLVYLCPMIELVGCVYIGEREVILGRDLVRALAHALVPDRDVLDGESGVPRSAACHPRRRA